MADDQRYTLLVENEPLQLEIRFPSGNYVLVIVSSNLYREELEQVISVLREHIERPRN